MRKQNQEITDTLTIDEILSKSEICRIAMMDDNGLPYIVPLNYGYKDNCIYAHCARYGKKIDLLKANNSVCFEIEQSVQIVKNDNPCKWSTSYRSVIGYATVDIISELENKRKGLEIIMAHYGAPDNIDFDIKQLESMVILKLSISSLTAKQSGNWINYQP